MLSGGWPFLGHLLELRRDPLSLMRRVRAECGEIGEFRLAGHRIALLTGAEAQEAFFRAPDEQLDQAATLAQALNARGTMDLQCQDVDRMKRYQDAADAPLHDEL